MGGALERVIVLVSAVLFAGGVPPCAARAQDEPAAARSPERLEPGLGDEPDAMPSDEVGHIRIVERDDPAGDAGSALLAIGGSLAGLGALTLLGIGVDLAIVVTTVWGGSLRVPLAPSELSFSALGALGGGLVVAVVGVIVDALAPPARETRGR
jgi:hypothetical protein